MTVQMILQLALAFPGIVKTIVDTIEEVRAMGLPPASPVPPAHAQRIAGAFEELRAQADGWSWEAMHSGEGS